MKPNTGRRILIIGLVIAGAVLVFELLLAAKKNNQGQQDPTADPTAKSQQPVYLVPDASSGNYTTNTKIIDSYNQNDVGNHNNYDYDNDPSHRHLPPPPQPPPVHIPPQPPPVPAPQPPPLIGPPGGGGAPPPPPQRYQQYTVRSGDTLSKIAQQFGLSWQAIYDVNKSTVDSTARAHGKTSNWWNWIFPGETLQIPQ